MSTFNFNNMNNGYNQAWSKSGSSSCDKNAIFAHADLLVACAFSLSLLALLIINILGAIIISVIISVVIIISLIASKVLPTVKLPVN